MTRFMRWVALVVALVVAILVVAVSPASARPLTTDALRHAHVATFHVSSSGPAADPR